MSANFSGVWKKNIGGVLRRQSTRPKKRLQAKVCWKENLLFHRFRTLRKWFFALWKKMAKCQNWNLRVHGNSLMKTFVWKILVFLSFFGHFEIIFRPLDESFSKPLSALLFNCPEEHCAEIVFWKKSVFPLLTRSKKTFGNLSHIWIAWSQKHYCMCPESQCGQEFFYCSDRNLVFLFNSVHRDFFSRLQAKPFCQVVKNAFYVSIE